MAPSKSLATIAAREAALGAVDAEIIEEQASSLGRAGRRLEKAIAELKAADGASAVSEANRAALLAEAREALWFLVVQREAMGIRGASEVLAVYEVPAEVSRGISLPGLNRRWRR